MPAPLISLALHRSCPLVRRQMAGMVPSDLLMKRVSSPAPRGLLTSFFQTRSLDALAPGAPPAGAPPRRPPPRSALARTTVLKAVPQVHPFPISVGQLRRAASTLFGAWWHPLAASRPPPLPPPMPRPAASSTAVVAAAVAAATSAIAGHHRCRCSYHLRTCAPACHLRTSGRCRRQCRCPCWLLRHRR